MNSSHNRKIITALIGIGTKSTQKHLELEQSQLGRETREADHEFAQQILDASGKAKSVEDLVFLEQSLQKIDMMKAKAEQDRNSIAASQKNYIQFSRTIEQMRKAPGSYLRLNMGHKDTGGDPEKIVKGNSLDFITGNITRMQNRASFSPESERDIWDARIAVARKTIELFQSLHRTLVKDFERKDALMT